MSRISIITFGRNGKSRIYQIPAFAIYFFAAFLVVVTISGLAASRYKQLDNEIAVMEDVYEIQGEAILVGNEDVESKVESTEAAINDIVEKIRGMQADVDRIRSIGDRLSEMAGIEFGGDAAEDETPADGQGGPVSALDSIMRNDADVVTMFMSLSAALDRESERLGALERKIPEWLDDQQSQKLGGYPIIDGWLTSKYGIRKDPFTGKPAFHSGVDFSGKYGSEIVAIGGGVVVFAGRRGGYGKMVDIDHGDGHVTRYAHAKKILVKSGDQVRKGDPIAVMGSTGRSTGPHVHLELRKNGKLVNPKEFLFALN